MRTERERLDRIDMKIEKIQEELQAMRLEFEALKAGQAAEAEKPAKRRTAGKAKQDAKEA